MSWRASVLPGEDQLRLVFGERPHPAVEHARAVRVEAGLPQSLTAPEVLVHLRAILDVERYVDGRRGHALDSNAS